MNLSDLVHRSTHGHPDHPIEPFYIPSTPSSSSSPNGVYPAPPPPPDMYDAYPHLEEWSVPPSHPSPLQQPSSPSTTDPTTSSLLVHHPSPTYHLSPSSSPTRHNAISPTHQNPSSSTTTTALSPTTASSASPYFSDEARLKDEELLRQKRRSKLQPMTINGSNVTADNIEDGYIQFILHHDPDSIGDGIEGMMYIRRKFTSVPRTGDLSYTTWDIFVLVNKLHNRQIKNWSQLVGQLGLSDMLGRPQFAQRVKRWMHKYKIDTFFDYLMGTPFDFHAEDEKKYSGCLLMGNYQKRRGGDDEQEGSTQKRRRQIITDRPILMAGSRKRMPGESLLLLDKREEEDDEDDEDNQVETDVDEEEMDNDTQPMDLPPDDEEEDERPDDNEEDELASTSSTTAPSSPAHPSAGPTPSSSCASCDQLSTTVHDLQSQLSALTQSVALWQAQMESQARSLQQQVAQLMDEQAKAAQTRKKLAHALLSDS